jgi:hypothetical protein
VDYPTNKVCCKHDEKQGAITMFEDGRTPYGKERHQQFIAEAQRQRLIDSLPNRRQSLPAQIIKTATLVLASLTHR